MTLIKIVVYVPVSHSNKIRKALCNAGAGHVGNYDYCSFSVKGIGRFRPLDGAHPFIGKQGEIKEVEEERIETVCQKKDIKKITTEIRKVHPYEKPVIEFIKLEMKF